MPVPTSSPPAIAANTGFSKPKPSNRGSNSISADSSATAAKVFSVNSRPMWRHASQ